MPFGSERKETKTRKKAPGYVQKVSTNIVTPEAPYCSDPISDRSTAKMVAPKYNNGQGKLDILERAKRHIDSNDTFKLCYPELKKGQVPQYWQWKKVCGHATDVVEADDMQICSQCSCVFPKEEHRLIKPEKTKGKVTCSYKGYLTMKEIMNCF
jgi:hypothetical protein